MRKAIVIGCDVGGLGVIRSLGIKGFKVLALSYDRTDFGNASKYVYKSVRIPHPRREEKDFVDFLIRNSHIWKEALILESNDDIAVSLSKNKDYLSKFYKIVTPDWEILKRFIYKSETYRLSEKCGVPYPRTFHPVSYDEICKLSDEITYPCIVRPVLGQEFMNEFNSKNFKVNDKHELLSRYTLCLKKGHDTLLQEIIPGPDSNLYRMMMYINSRGVANAKFLLRRIRQAPPQFGFTRVGTSYTRISQVEEFTEKILREADFRGFAEAEFKLDPRDNKLKLIEINVRMVKTNWLATYCGVNFPWTIYMDLVEDKQIEAIDYKEDVYWIDLYQDILNSIFRHNKEDFVLSLPEGILHLYHPQNLNKSSSYIS